MRSTRRTVLGAIATAAALAGCVGGGNEGDPTATATPTTTTASPDTTTESSPMPTSEPTEDGTSGPAVRIDSHPDFGEILVGPDQMALYMFDSDAQGSEESTCYDSCAQTWPPLTVSGSPTKADAVTATVTAFERETGETQVVAGGWPLYYYAPDENPGDARGQGVGDVWWVLAPDGTPIRSASPTTAAANGY